MLKMLIVCAALAIGGVAPASAQPSQEAITACRAEVFGHHREVGSPDDAQRSKMKNCIRRHMAKAGSMGSAPGKCHEQAGEMGYRGVGRNTWEKKCVQQHKELMQGRR
jgi:hypothetical protein